MTAAKAPKKGKRPKLPASLVPHTAAVLAIDPGEVSGWAIWQRGEPAYYGVIEDVFSPLVGELVAHFVSRYQGPHVAVVERPFRVRFANQTSIGTADAIWRRRLTEARVPFARVYPSSWRSAVLGKGWGNASRDLARAKEQEVACAMVEVSSIHPDAAPALLMGRWGAFAGETLAVLPKGKR
jgi:Holliday junction resolvasome RuvABC endonuclease subunit